MGNGVAGFLSGLGGSGLFGAAASVYGTIQNNKNVDKSLKAQAEENEKTREYNLQLAKQQNQWNVEQWQRENAARQQAAIDERAYNSPAAQKARLESAGLNSDMMYGGGISNTSPSATVASSPQMSAGAPATPVDWSSLAGKKTLGSAIQESLAAEMVRAQINSVKADTKKTLADAGLSEISLEYADAQARLGLKMSEQEYEKAKQDYELGVKALEKSASELEGITLDNAYKAIRNAFESEALQKQTEILAEELHIKKSEAAHAMEYYAAQLLGIQADNSWKDAAWIVQQKNGVPTLIKYGSEALNNLIDALINFIPSRRPKGKGITINNNIP